MLVAVLRLQAATSGLLLVPCGALFVVMGVMLVVLKAEAAVLRGIIYPDQPTALSTHPAVHLVYRGIRDFPAALFDERWGVFSVATRGLQDHWPAIALTGLLCLPLGMTACSHGLTRWCSGRRGARGEWGMTSADQIFTMGFLARVAPVAVPVTASLACVLIVATPIADGFTQDLIQGAGWTSTRFGLALLDAEARGVLVYIPLLAAPLLGTALLLAHVPFLCRVALRGVVLSRPHLCACGYPAAARAAPCPECGCPVGSHISRAGPRGPSYRSLKRLRRALRRATVVAIFLGFLHAATGGYMTTHRAVAAILGVEFQVWRHGGVNFFATSGETYAIELGDSVCVLRLFNQPTGGVAAYAASRRCRLKDQSVPADHNPVLSVWTSPAPDGTSSATPFVRAGQDKVYVYPLTEDWSRDASPDRVWMVISRRPRPLSVRPIALLDAAARQRLQPLENLINEEIDKTDTSLLVKHRGGAS